MSEPPQTPDPNGPAHGGEPGGDPQYPPPGSWGPPAGGPPQPPRPTPGGQPRDPGAGGAPQAPYPAPPLQYQPQPYEPQPYQQVQQPQYQQPQYPPPGYPGAGYPGGSYPQPASASLADRMGGRLRRRPEPRFGISLAGAGAALVLIGLFVWSAGYLIDGANFDFSEDGHLTSGGNSHRFLGTVLFLVLAVIGYAIVILKRRGPLATAGIVSGAIAVPAVLLFLTFDLGNLLSGDYPVNIDAIYIVSIIVWLGSYLFVPGARGRAFLLASAASGLAAYVGLKAAGSSLLGSAVTTASGNGVHTGGTDSLAAVGLVFGLSYYAIAASLDKAGRHGAAVAMAYAGFGTTVGGIAAAAPSFKQVGTGVLLIVLGLLLSWYGGRFGRRFTSWAWAVGLVIGVGLLVQKAAPNSYTGAGISFIVIGAVIAVAAHLFSATTNEAPEVVEDDEARARLI